MIYEVELKVDLLLEVERNNVINTFSLIYYILYSSVEGKKKEGRERRRENRNTSPCGKLCRVNKSDFSFLQEASNISGENRWKDNSKLCDECFYTSRLNVNWILYARDIYKSMTGLSNWEKSNIRQSIY